MMEHLLAFEFMGKAAGYWLAFGAVILVLMILDLGVLHRKQREIGIRESLVMSACYALVAVAFGAWVWFNDGATSGRDFFTGYLVEESLSLDNIFVMSLVFYYFAVPRLYQHRVLFWGIIGAIILRGLFVGLGAVMIAKAHWILYVFGAFLVFSGANMLFAEKKALDLESNPLLGFLRRRMRVTASAMAALVAEPVPVTPAMET